MEGMELLFTSYYKPLVVWADTFLRDVACAEDLVQDFFLKLWEAGRFERLLPETLRSYLFTAVRNAVGGVRQFHGRRVPPGGGGGGEIARPQPGDYPRRVFAGKEVQGAGGGVGNFGGDGEFVAGVGVEAVAPDAWG